MSELRVFTGLNNYSSTLVSAIASGATTIIVTSAGTLPALAATEYYLLTLIGQTGNTPEIVKVTARTGTTLTVTRAQESTAAQAWNLGVAIEAYVTAADLTLFAQLSHAAAFTTLSTSGLLSANAGLTVVGTTTLAATTLGGVVSGGGQQINNVIIGTVTPLAGAFTTLSTSGLLSANADLRLGGFEPFNFRQNSGLPIIDLDFNGLSGSGTSTPGAMYRVDLRAGQARHAWWTREAGVAYPPGAEHVRVSITDVGLLSVTAGLTVVGTTTLAATTLGGVVSGGGQQINNVIIGTVTPLAGAFTTVSTSGLLSANAGLTVVGNVGIGATPTSLLELSGANSAADLRLTRSNNVAATSEMGLATWRAPNASGTVRTWAQMGVVVDDATNTTEDCTWTLRTIVAGVLTTVASVSATASALGAGATATAANTTSTGKLAAASAARAIATGANSIANKAGMENITATNVIRAHDGTLAAGDEVWAYAGRETIIYGANLSCTQAPANNLVSITLPAGAKFFPNEVGAHIVSADLSNTAHTVWTTRTSAADNGWLSITWAKELGLLVAVAYTGVGNRVMTSPNGVNWTIQTSAADNNWFSVTWAKELGLLVVVADTGVGNRVMTSPNGVNWTIQTSAADNNWISVTWARELGLLVAVAYTGVGNRVMTSPNGVNWTIRTSAADNDWFSVTWAKELGLLVAVALSGVGNRVMTSPNGVNWTIRTSAADNGWLSITWAKELGLLVAVANSGVGNRVMTSPNGVNWTIRTSAADNDWISVTWARELGRLVAVADTGVGNRVMTSPNGVNWTIQTSAADNGWRSVTWVKELGLLVAVANSGVGNRVMTSSNLYAPVLSFGVVTYPKGIAFDTKVTEGVVGQRNRIIDVTTDGVTSITVSLVTASDATTYTVRPYIKGICVED